jgi:hypothetical protein
MRQNTGKKRSPKGGGGITCRCQNRRQTATVLRCSGVQFPQPGGFSGSGKGGELERRGRAFIGAGEESKLAGIKAGFNAERDYCTGVTPA